jgi:hypothetical protein
MLLGRDEHRCLLAILELLGQGRLWVKGRRGRQADGTTGLPPAPEIAVRAGTYASCQLQTIGVSEKTALTRAATIGRSAS